jgi:hypothetical protein
MIQINNRCGGGPRMAIESGIFAALADFYSNPGKDAKK